MRYQIAAATRGAGSDVVKGTRTVIGEDRQMKRVVLALVLLVLAGAASLYVAETHRPGTRPKDLDARMQSIVANVVANDSAIKHCVLAVAKGDGTFRWAGAAGIASQQGMLPMSAVTPIYIASITKLYTATIVMLLYEKGMLALDDPIAKFLPAQLIQGINHYQGKDYTRAITIADLLSHRSGIADYYEETAKDGKSLADWLQEKPERQWSVDQTIARARDELPPHSTPGTDTFYSDTNFQLLGKIVEVVTRKPLDFAYQDLLFRPLGLRHTWLIGHPGADAAIPADVFRGDRNITRSRANTAYWADGGIVATAQDMLIFLQALNEGRIIHPETLALMHRWHSMEFPIQYGYGTMYVRPPGFVVTKILGFAPVWGHSGSTGSFLYFAPELDLYVSGTIDQTASRIKPFVVMWRVMRAIEAAGSTRQDSGAD